MLPASAAINRNAIRPLQLFFCYKLHVCNVHAKDADNWQHNYVGYSHTRTYPSLFLKDPPELHT